MAQPDAYLPLSLNSVSECELYMLPGIDASTDCFTVAGLRITRLPYSDWSIIEKSTFISDLQSTYAYDRLPMYCVFAGGDPQADEESAQQRTLDREACVMRLVLALRLSREEPIFDPTEYIVYRRSAYINVRDVRVYGRAGYERQAETMLQPVDLAHLEVVYESLEVFEHYRLHSPLDVAVALFGRSYDEAAVEPRDRMLLLMAALEALTDGKQGPLRSIRWPEDAITAFLARYQHLRNAIVHEAIEVGDSQAQSALLRRMVRYLICEGVRNELLFPGEKKSWGLALLEGMRDVTTFGSSRLDLIGNRFEKWGA